MLEGQFFSRTLRISERADFIVCHVVQNSCIALLRLVSEMPRKVT